MRYFFYILIWTTFASQATAAIHKTERDYSAIHRALHRFQQVKQLNGIKKGEGCSVSYIFYDQEGDFAIFKPQGEDSWGPNVQWFAGRWRRKCLHHIKTFRPFLQHIGGDLYCEVASKFVADIVKKLAGLPHDLISPTTIVSLSLVKTKEAVRGSFQVFEKGVVLGKDYLGLRMDYSIEKYSDLYEKRRENFYQNFQWLVILDVITGHMDRHTNNFMIRERDGTLLAIDSGLSFAPWHPDPSENSPTRYSASEELTKLYYWANPKAEFKLANSSFSERSKETIKKIYENRYELKNLVKEIYRRESGSMPVARALTMVQRIELLHQCAECPNFKIKDFWNYRTREQVEEALSIQSPYSLPEAIEKENLPSSIIEAILAVPSLLADKYHLVGSKGGAIEQKLNEIAALIDPSTFTQNKIQIIEKKFKEVENLAEIASLAKDSLLLNESL